MLKIAVCDDESMFGHRLENMINDYINKRGEACKIDRFSSGVEFLNKGADIATYRIVFLDINMEQLDGIETARQLRILCEDTFVVFVTAFINYTLDGYRVNAFRYLLKTADNFEENLAECMDAIFQKLSIVPEHREIRFIEGKKDLFIGKLLYIESNLHKLYFHVLEDKMVEYTLKDSLNHIQEEFDSQSLIRIHQSYLVNLAFVKAIENNLVILADNTKLPIAKSRYKQAVEQITLYKGVF